MRTVCAFTYAQALLANGAYGSVFLRNLEMNRVLRELARMSGDDGILESVTGIPAAGFCRDFLHCDGTTECGKE